MQNWISDYLASQKRAIDSLPLDAIARCIDILTEALRSDRQIFVCGNGGSASNASHFATDLGKGSSDAIGKRFRVLSLNDNVSWLTALGNDYSYADVFVRQLENYARPGDVLICASVSGSSPNVVNVLEWGKKQGLRNIVLVGAKKGKAAELGDETIVIGDTHYGRVEDVHMHILHILCYAFMERPEIAK